MPTPQVNIATAFLAGLVSFISPCVLPLVPAYLSFLTGSSVEQLKTDESAANKVRILVHSLSFIAGFTLIFVLLGISASAIGGLLQANKELIAQIGGIIIVILGLSMMGMLRIPFLMMDKRVQVRRSNRSYVTSFLVGIGFAAWWSPCIGPILGAILLIASQAHTGQAVLLLLAYSLGLAIPFFVTAAAISSALGFLGRIKRFLPAIEFTAGAFLVATGVVLVTNSFLRIAGFFYQYIPQPRI